MKVVRHAHACSVLSDSRFVPPSVRTDAPAGTIAWLRAQVSRFSIDEVHTERRAAVERVLSVLDPTNLHAAARVATLDQRGSWDGVPTAVLGAALGMATGAHLAAAVEGAVTAYLSGEETPTADAAVGTLLALFAGSDDPIARITVLLQAHSATTGLIRNALTHVTAGADVEGLLHETLRFDPPLLVTRRVDRVSGEEVLVDVVAANRDASAFVDPERFDATRGPTPHLTFGHGVRPCPAQAQAVALAAGVLEALTADSDGSETL